ncbi:reduced folate carrier domain-containing protein [Ditylenchus destructor]|uniref:Reduced folate carrier domain-containing protein n=1 Tax=Ditylenchus destructor TaxID=166010 RepID=A0AAD4R0E4_9BILA|nr:reduced folate carrier domain-containing protein [Ditylenchus destructor]
MDKWLVTALVLCTYGMLKEFKPSEPYLYRYQQRNLNISGDVLTAEVYPYWTYSYLLFLVPAFLLTDVLLYKPILILESISYISVWITLIFGRSVVGNYVQVLWGEAQKDMHNAKVYNGFVEGAIPFLSAMTLMGLQKPRVDWDKHGELCLSVAALVQFVVILIMSLAESVYVMYASYALFRIVFQCMITIAQSAKPREQRLIVHSPSFDGIGL